MTQNIILQGLELMVFGMGTVIVFLTLLVFATTLMSALVNHFSPAPVPSEPGAAPPAVTDQARLVAVITAAIHKHRSRR